MYQGREWPYPSEIDQTETLTADVLVVGGGIAGCMAAIAAARRGQKVILVDKGAVKRSGAGGTGIDHWNLLPPIPLTCDRKNSAMMDDNDGYNNPFLTTSNAEAPTTA